MAHFIGQGDCHEKIPLSPSASTSGAVDVKSPPGKVNFRVGRVSGRLPFRRLEIVYRPDAFHDLRRFMDITQHAVTVLVGHGRFIQRGAGNAGGEDALHGGFELLQGNILFGLFSGHPAARSVRGGVVEILTSLPDADDGAVPHIQRHDELAPCRGLNRALADDVVFRDVVVHGVETLQCIRIICQFTQHHAAVQGGEALGCPHIPQVIQRIFPLQVAEAFFALDQVFVRAGGCRQLLVMFRYFQTEIAGTGVDAQERIRIPLRYFNKVVAPAQGADGTAVPLLVRFQYIHADAGDFFIQFRIVQQGLVNGGTGVHAGWNACAQPGVKGGKVREGRQARRKYAAADVHADQVGNHLVRFQFRGEADDAAGAGMDVRHDAHPAAFKGGVMANVLDLGACQIF